MQEERMEKIIVFLSGELEEAKQEIENMKNQMADLEVDIDERDESITALNEMLKERDEYIDELKGSKNQIRMTPAQEHAYDKKENE